MTSPEFRRIAAEASTLFRREILRRYLPHGLISPRYFLPGQSSDCRIHRRLWLSALPRVPRPFFWLIEGFLWSRWTFLYSWRFTFRAVKRMGPTSRNHEGSGLFKQFVRVLCMSILHAIPPSEIYAFRLYGKDRHRRVWQYVFTQEASSFHRWRNVQEGKSGAPARALGDKLRCGEILATHGLPVVWTGEAVVREGRLEIPEEFADLGRWFVKPRHGSGGRGCFVLERDGVDAGIRVYSTRSGMVGSRASWSILQDHLVQEPYLIQPFMANHPDLAGLCDTKDAITVRVITEAPAGHAVRCYAALLEIPGPVHDYADHDEGRRAHIILPIDLNRGTTRSWHDDSCLAWPDTRYRQGYQRAVDRVIPLWGICRESALSAHTLFVDVYAIAWDYVITPEGPFLLEGNSGWGTRTPQMLNGGLLASM